MCSDTVGVAPVSLWMTPQSSSFSKTLRGSPAPGKRPKRVPPVPTPQEGTATLKFATAFVIVVDLDAAARELRAQVRVVRGERGRVRLVGRRDVVRIARIGERCGHGSLVGRIDRLVLIA